MAGGYRVILAGALAALVFVTFGLGWASGYVLNNPSEQRQQPYRYAADKPPEIETTASGRPNSQAFEYRTPCENPKGREESDLCAQWKAANAAEHSAFWTKWGFWVGVVGSALLLWQIILTRRAVEDTSEATEAMREANRIAAAEKRAFLHLDSITFTQDGDKVQLDISIKNFGQSPARKVSLRTAAGYYPMPLPEELPEISAPRLPSGDLAPGGQRFSPLTVPLLETRRGSILAGTWAMVAIGEIDYEDFLGNAHREEFRTFSTGAKFDQGVMTAYPNRKSQS